MPSSAPMVTTPVPPMPGTRMLYGSSSAGSVGIGSLEKSASPLPLFLRKPPPWMVTNEGQKPFTQEKSLLQELWSIARLRPNSVSSGRIDTQLDFTPQSPQPSQTSELIIVRLGGSTISLRLRRRRFSAAQVWS